MKVFSSTKDWLDFRKNNLTITSLGFIPTMGHLHQGHGSLIKKSLQDNDQTCVSIYINPTQFNNPSDLQKYPKTLEKDLDYLQSLQVDYVFTPTYEDIYPDDYLYQVTEKKKSLDLDGIYRPGHFDGVLTIVLKLFMIISAHRSYFGEKDYQQFLLIQGMAKAFFISTEVIVCPTIREDHGLAMSSRNSLLSPSSRKKASLIYELLEQPSFSLEQIQIKLEQEGFEVDYIQEKWGRRFIAVWIDGIRLIDNISYKVL